MVAAVGLAVAIYAVVNFAFSGIPLSVYVCWVASSACFGILIGGIYAFDYEAEVKLGNSPELRAFIGVVAGAANGFIWQWPFEGIMLSAIVGSILGLLGMVWAKYVNF